jgi:uncharacterized protein (TIGR02145 family)
MKSNIWFVIPVFLLPSLSCTLKRVNSVIKDIDGNWYTSVIIGKQEWMHENLKTTRYNDGTPISNLTDSAEWIEFDSPAYVWYDNDISNKDTYGALYNWNAVGTRTDICPAGWQVARDIDWKKLENHLGMIYEEIEGTGWRGTDQGGKLKETGTLNWDSPNVGATNEYGFSAVPGGRRTEKGVFLGINRGCTIWTFTETSYSNAIYRHLSTGNTRIGRNPEGEKQMGLAVRCIKDK